MNVLGLITQARVVHSKDSETSSSRITSYVSAFRSMRTTLQNDSSSHKSSDIKAYLQAAKADELKSFVKPYATLRLHDIDFLTGIIWHDTSLFSTSAWSATTAALKYCEINTFFNLGKYQGHIGLGSMGQSSRQLIMKNAHPLATLISELRKNSEINSSELFLPKKILFFSELPKDGDQKGSLVSSSKKLHFYRYGRPKNEIQSIVDSTPLRRNGTAYLVEAAGGKYSYMTALWEDGSPISNLDVAIKNDNFQVGIESILDNFSLVCSPLNLPIFIDLVVLDVKDIENCFDKKFLKKIQYNNSKKRKTDLIKLIAFSMLILVGAGGIYDYQEREYKAQLALEKTEINAKKNMELQEKLKAIELQKNLIAKNTLKSTLAQPEFNYFYASVLYLLQNVPIKATTSIQGSYWYLSDWSCVANNLVDLESGKVEIISNCSIEYAPHGSAEVDSFYRYLKENAVVEGFEYKASPSVIYHPERNTITDDFSFPLIQAGAYKAKSQDEVMKDVQKTKSMMDLNGYSFSYVNGGNVIFKDPDTAKRLFKMNASGSSYNPYEFINWDLSFQLNDVRNNLQKLEIPADFGVQEIQGREKKVTIKGLAFYEKK